MYTYISLGYFEPKTGTILVAQIDDFANSEVYLGMVSFGFAMFWGQLDLDWFYN